MSTRHTTAGALCAGGFLFSVGAGLYLGAALYALPAAIGLVGIIIGLADKGTP